MRAKHLELGLSVVLTVAALIIAVSLVKREYFRPSATTLSRDTRVEYDPTWRDELRHSTIIGDSAAPILLVEYADFECPACKYFEFQVLGTVKQEYGGRLAVAFMHFPLPRHRFAYKAALAAECAFAQGKMADFIRVAYSKQDSIGVKTWSAFASEIAVGDHSEFLRCIDGPGAASRVDSAIAMAHKQGVRGTPTVAVNGWRFNSTPSVRELTETIDDISNGRRPRLAEKR